MCVCVCVCVCVLNTVMQGRLMKGGEPDIETVARMVLFDWQRGLLNFVCLFGCVFALVLVFIFFLLFFLNNLSE